MSAIGNVLWFVLGGVFVGLAWWAVGLLCAITVVGLPWAKACFVMGNFSFFPFGREAIRRNQLTGQHDLGTGAWGWLGNVLWFVLAGWWLALSHVISGLALLITIVGIPFAIQHFKLAGIALFPVGVEVVDVHLAREAHTFNAQQRLVELRGQTPINSPNSSLPRSDGSVNVNINVNRD